MAPFFTLALASLLAAVLHPPTAQAQAPADTDAPQLTEYQTRFYEIHTNLSREEAVDIGRHMDLVFSEYDRVLRALRGSARGKQPMYLLRTQDDYIAHLKTYNIDATNSGGMFFWRGNRSRLAIFVEGRSTGDVLSTLQHEGFHQFAWIKMRDNLPIWVNEGLAEYFGDAIVVDGKVRHGIVDRSRLTRLREANDQQLLLPFADILTLDSNRWSNNLRSGSPQGYLQYDQSWSIVHFLIHDSPRRIRPAFENYLKLLSTNRNPQQAWNDAFGQDSTDAFEARYDRFLASLEPDHYSSALTRLRFLASGLQHLHELEQSPEDLEQFREQLQEAGFGITYRSHGTTTTLRAADDDLYAYQDRRDNLHDFQIRPAPDTQANQPPQILAPQLSPPARIEWITDEQGKLRSEVVFGR